MSELSDRIANRHKGIYLEPRYYVCACEDYETARDVRAHESHIAQATEAAVREQIAASCNKFAVVEGEHGRSNYAEILQEAAEIARGRL